jgi:hypothetical protein
MFTFIQFLKEDIGASRLQKLYARTGKTKTGKTRFLRISELRKEGQKYIKEGGLCPKCGSPNTYTQEQFSHIPKNYRECVDCGTNYIPEISSTVQGDPPEFRLTSKLWSSYNPFVGHDTSDEHDDQKDMTEKVPMGDDSDLGPNGTARAGTNMEAHTPNDLSPRIAAGNNILPEKKTGLPTAYADNAIGPRVGGDAFMPETKKEQAELANPGIKEGFSDPSTHPFHDTVTKAGFNHIGTSSMMGRTTHAYTHTNSSEPLKLKTSPEGHSWEHGGRSGTNKNSLAFHAMQTEGIFDFLKKPAANTPKFKPMGDKTTSHYRTSHSYGDAHHDIEPSSVPVFKPSFDYNKSKTVEKPGASREEEVQPAIKTQRNKLPIKKFLNNK